MTDRFPEYEEYKAKKRVEHPFYEYPESDHPICNDDGRPIPEEDITDNRPAGPWPSKIPITFFGFKKIKPKADIIEEVQFPPIYPSPPDNLRRNYSKPFYSSKPIIDYNYKSE